MNVCHFEYEHDMKLVGELLVSAPFMGLSICLPLSLYFLIFTSSWNCIKAWVYQYVFLSVFPYIWVYQFVFLSLYFLIFSSLHATVSKHGFINMFFSFYFLIYGFINVFSLFVFSYFHPSVELYQRCNGSYFSLQTWYRCYGFYGQYGLTAMWRLFLAFFL